MTRTLLPLLALLALTPIACERATLGASHVPGVPPIGTPGQDKPPVITKDALQVVQVTYETATRELA